MIVMQRRIRDVSGSAAVCFEGQSDHRGWLSVRKTRCLFLQKLGKASKGSRRPTAMRVVDLCPKSWFLWSFAVDSKDGGQTRRMTSQIELVSDPATAATPLGGKRSGLFAMFG